MKRTIALGAAVAALALAAGVARARNEHCAGGIQYVTLALKDKDRGNLDDYTREIHKAVDQLTECAKEDPADFEAQGYLGWALCEIDSTRLAGQVFTKAIDGLNAKGDKKRAADVAVNRESYWVRALNDGIAKVNAAQNAYPDYLKTPENDADKTLKGEATKNYDQALVSFTHAAELKPGDPKTLRNLGSVYAFMGDFGKAEAVFREGLKAAPTDSSLLLSVKSVRTNYANKLIEEKKYDDAITFFSGLIKDDPSNPDLQLGLADAYFKRAQSKEGDARKPDFKLAGDAYAAAAKLKPNDADPTFNAALAYQNGGESKLAEPLWRATLKMRPDDVDAISALGSCLSDLGQFDEAIKVLWDGVSRDPKNKILHRQLGAVYTKAHNNAKSTEELMVYLALQNGQPVADPAATAKSAKAGTARAQTLASAGTPDQIIPWEIQGEKVESWFYWSKKAAYHFKADALYLKSDWSAPAPAGGAQADAPKKK
ncbi:MAG TPA: tetratricopeptide repeat protein [Candidatus Eisenbacteria bacterium]